KAAGRSVFSRIGLAPREVSTVRTIGIGTPEEMAAEARTFDSRLIKLKLDGEMPVARVEAVSKARPDAEIIVDVNQGWTVAQLVESAPALAALGVAMIEQPLPRDSDEVLEGYDPPLPLCADESCLDTSDIGTAARRYQVINIKLDKTGGLTEALDLAGRALSHGLA